MRAKKSITGIIGGAAGMSETELDGALEAAAIEGIKEQIRDQRMEAIAADMALGLNDENEDDFLIVGAPTLPSL